MYNIVKFLIADHITLDVLFMQQCVEPWADVCLLVARVVGSADAVMFHHHG